MGIARSTFCDAPAQAADDTALVEAIHAIKDEFEAYGWRRMQAALGQQGWVVNHKKLKRLMRERGLNARRWRRYVTTTDSDHDQPIFPNRTKDIVVDGPDQLWIADLTYVAVVAEFVYVAVIMDAWARRIVGYAMSRRIDARLTLAALEAAIALRRPPPGCIHHGDRGSQDAAERYRDRLREAKLVGSMGRRGNPYANPMMESLMKTLKVEGVYPLEFETAEDVAEQLPVFIKKYNSRCLHSSLGYLSPEQYEKQHARPPAKDAARSCPARGAHSTIAGGIGLAMSHPPSRPRMTLAQHALSRSTRLQDDRAALTAGTRPAAPQNALLRGHLRPPPCRY